MGSIERTVDCLALSEVGVILAAQQAIAIATNNALDISRRVNNRLFKTYCQLDHIPAVNIKK
jgi:hypothetical protein